MKIEQISNKARKIVIDIITDAKTPHIGSCLSLIDILISIYFDVFNKELMPRNFKSLFRPRIILSKGHAVAALYAVLYLKGYITKEQLLSYCKNNGLPGHADTVTNGVEFSTGSLGHGLAVGVGMALAHKLNKIKSPVIVIMGDGECEEGAVWEAANFAASKKINNLIIIIDNNGLQAYDKTSVHGSNLLHKKWRAFGFSVLTVDGHNLVALRKVIKRSLCMKTPSVIIAKTVKGKGIISMENRIESHYFLPDSQKKVSK